MPLQNAAGDIAQASNPRQRQREERRAARVALSFRNLTFNPWDDPIGHDWYTRAGARIRERFGAEADLFCDLLAATSPQTDVVRNVALALDALDRWRRRIPQNPWIGSHGPNIARACAREPLSGPKVRAFAAALKGDSDAVVVDTWMLRAAGLGTPKRLKKPSSFRIVHRAIRLVAEAEGLPATQVQARVWMAYRAANWTARKGAGDGYLPL